ncbi:MAG: hypothetical protein VB115_16605 [Christensenellaceae bacterium]|nr:hypothetical protein [Christensenellaceae bacterium]
MAGEQSEVILLDLALIRRFREKLNEHNFCYRKYTQFKGRNKWNCLCSATDWLCVAVDSISFDLKTDSFGYDNRCSIDVLSLIMRVALIDDCINELHKVLHNTNVSFLEGDRSIFGNNPFGKTDRSYFKLLRACFAAHPIDISSIKGGPYYASWSFGGLFGFAVLLSPSSPSEPEISISIEFDQLEAYAVKRYDHLKELIEEIDRQYGDFVEEWRVKAIPRSEDPLKQINILFDEQINRFDDPKYRLIIAKLKLILENQFIASENMSTLDPATLSPIARIFYNGMRALIPLIDELYESLQDMDIRGLEFERSLSEVWDQLEVYLAYDEAALSF